MTAIETRSSLIYTRCALAAAIAMNLYGLWLRMPEMISPRVTVYLFLLFPYAFLAMAISSSPDRRLLRWVRAGSLLFAGLWAWVVLGGTTYGPSTTLAVILHIALGAVVGIPAVILGKRARRAATR